MEIRSEIYRCANPLCRVPLGVDHVTLVTTAHVRRFCWVGCIEPGRRASDDIGAGMKSLSYDAGLREERNQAIELLVDIQNRLDLPKDLASRVREYLAFRNLEK